MHWRLRPGQRGRIVPHRADYPILSRRDGRCGARAGTRRVRRRLTGGGLVSDRNDSVCPDGSARGLAPCSAIFVSDDEWAAQTVGDRSDPSRVWGDASLSDPWSGPLAIITTHSADPGYQHQYARPTRVNSRPAEVSPMPLFQGIDSAAWGHIVTMRRPSGAIVELALRGSSAKEAVAMASKVDIDRNRPSLPNDALGSTTAVISTSPPDSGVWFGIGKWSLGYKQTNGPGDPADPGFLTLDVGGQPARPNALELTALYAVEARKTTVNGQPGLDYAQFDAKKGPYRLGVDDARGTDHQRVRVRGVTRATARRGRVSGADRRCRVGEDRGQQRGVPGHPKGVSSRPRHRRIGYAGARLTRSP
jgi:hypothetical protein